MGASVLRDGDESPDPNGRWTLRREPAGSVQSNGAEGGIVSGRVAEVIDRSGNPLFPAFAKVRIVCFSLFVFAALSTDLAKGCNPAQNRIDRSIFLDI